MNEKDAAVIKVLSELGLRDDPPVRPEFEHLYPKDDPDEQFYDDVIRLFTEGDLRRDNPGGEWLKDKQREESNLRKRHEFHGPYTATGYFKSPIWVTSEQAATFKGARGEHLRIDYDRVAEIQSWIEREGEFKPEYRPLVLVDSKGQPWILEGNHRIAAARKMGLDKIPIELRYVNGGEQADGPMAPAKLK